MCLAARTCFQGQMAFFLQNEKERKKEKKGPTFPAAGTELLALVSCCRWCWKPVMLGEQVLGESSCSLLSCFAQVLKHTHTKNPMVGRTTITGIRGKVVWRPEGQSVCKSSISPAVWFGAEFLTPLSFRWLKKQKYHSLQLVSVWRYPREQNWQKSLPLGGCYFNRKGKDGRGWEGRQIMGWLIHMLILDDTKDQKETRSGQGIWNARVGCPFRWDQEPLGVGEVVCHVSTWSIRDPGRGNSKGKILRQKHANCGENSRKLMSRMEWGRREQEMRIDRCEMVGKAGRGSGWALWGFWYFLWAC